MNQKLLQNISEKEKAKVKQIIEYYKDEAGNLISILQAVQGHFLYMPSYVLIYLSKKLRIPAAEIYSITTFYTQFKSQPNGKNYIVCCDGTGCHVKDGPLLLNFLENELGILSGETTEDKLYSIESVACLGCCAISPVCVINGQIFGNLTIKKLKIILKKIKEES